MDTNAILPPTGQPFSIVGTAEARGAISKLEDIADNAEMYDGAERQSAWDAAALLYAVLSHRDHLAGQVTELHASAVDAQERERQARTDALAYEGDRDDLTDQVRELRTDALLLATRIDESAAEDLILLDDSDREVVARILKAAGKEPHSPETRALTGEAKPTLDADVAMAVSMAKASRAAGVSVRHSPTLAEEAEYLRDHALPPAPPAMDLPTFAGGAKSVPMVSMRFIESPPLPGDKLLVCDDCGGKTPHRLTPSPEAGPWWHCSECGTATHPVDGIHATPTGSPS